MSDYEEGLVKAKIRALNSSSSENVSSCAVKYQSRWHCALNITDAIYDNRPLEEIKAIICSQKLSLGVCPIPRLQWKLYEAILKRNRTDVLEVLLKNGVDPNTRCPDNDPRRGTTALQAAVECNNLRAVELLVKHNANVNIGKAPELKRQLFYRANALYLAFQKDDPAMMKLLVAHYDPNLIHGGRNVLELACETGALKCIEVLLEEEKYKTAIKANEVPLDLGICHGAKVIPTLYSIGSKHGVYTSKHLGDCLCLVTQRSTFSNSRFGVGFPADITDIVLMLLEFGADVNHRIQLFQPKSETPLELLLSNPHHNKDLYIIRNLTALLLFHGGEASSSRVNSFMLRSISFLITGHVFPPQISTPKTVSALLSIIATLRQGEYANQITPDSQTPQRPQSAASLISLHSTGLNQRYKYGPALIVFSESEEQLNCPALKELMRVMLLNFDIRVDLLGEFSKGLPRCNCGPYIADVLTSLRSHKEYQMQVEYLHEHAAALRDGNRFTHNPMYEPDLLSQRFPHVRSLRMLTRAVLFNHLHLPIDRSCQIMMMPPLLRDFVCLK